jgi:hypothetical protein
MHGAPISHSGAKLIPARTVALLIGSYSPTVSAGPNLDVACGRCKALGAMPMLPARDHSCDAGRAEGGSAEWLTGCLLI